MWTVPKANLLPGRKSHPIHPKRKAKIRATAFKRFIALKTYNATSFTYFLEDEGKCFEIFLMRPQVTTQLTTDYVPFDATEPKPLMFHAWSIFT